MERLFIVSAEPLSWMSGSAAQPKGGVLSALKAISSRFEICWVDCQPQKGTPATGQRRALQTIGKRQKYLPVHVPPQELALFKSGFCNSSLWPLLHYMTSVYEYTEEMYDAYCSVNRQMAEQIALHAHPGDMIWVHDHPLMLLPSLLKKECQDFKVGYFLHTPFPSYEVFRYHPRREELITGMLGADLIGFHTFGYLRHFRSAVLRLLKIESDINSIVHQGFVTRIGVFPLGINWKEISGILNSAAFDAHLRKYRNQYQGKRVVLSVESLKRTKGIVHQLISIEKFLENYPRQKKKTVFIIIVSPPSERMRDTDQLQAEVEQIIGRLNGRFSSITNIPIHFISKPVALSQLCALYSLADTALVTPLMDGMNLVSKEYIACKKDGHGMLVLSEFAGAAQELFNAISVNPHNTTEVAQAIYTSLNMLPQEKRALMIPMREKIIFHDAANWAASFIDALKATSTGALDTFSNTRLARNHLSRFSRKTGKKALFLDYDGTLREFEKTPEAAVPGRQLLDIFARFQNRPDLDVYILSGRDRYFLEKHLSKFGFTLLGEHGYYLKHPGKKWQLLSSQIDLSWKKQIKEIFDLYALSTPGSAVESKTSTVVWHYRKSDPEFGRWKATELLGELTEVISNLPIEIHHGHFIVEVRSVHVGKDRAMEHFMNKIPYDLVLAAGDDQTDENMFRFRGKKVVTVKVGTGDTMAEFQVPSPREFRKLLLKI